MTSMTLDWRSNDALAVGKGATIQQFVANVGNDRLEIDVAPWGEGHFKVNGREVAHVDDAKDRRQAFREIKKIAERYVEAHMPKLDTKSTSSMIPTVKAKLLEGKRGLIVGIANENSIAWGCAKAFRAFGAELAITYLNDKAKKYVEPLAQAVEAPIVMPLEVNGPGPKAGASSTSSFTPSPFRRKRRCKAGSWMCRGRASTPRWTCPAGPSSAWRISPSR